MVATARPPATYDDVLNAPPHKVAEVVDGVLHLPVYARAGVRHAWLVDPAARTLEVLRLEGERWTLVATWADAAKVRAEPFDAIELDLAILWMDVEPAPAAP